MERICPKCGKTHYAATTCPYCGECVSTVPEKGNITATRQVSSLIQTPIQKQSPTIVVPKENRSIKEWVTLFFGGLIVLIIILTLSMGGDHGMSSSNLSSNTSAGGSSHYPEKTTDLNNGETAILQNDDFKESVSVFYNKTSGVVETKVNNLGDKAITSDTYIYAVDWGDVKYASHPITMIDCYYCQPIYPGESFSQGWMLDSLIDSNPKAIMNSIKLYVKFKDQKASWIISPTSNSGSHLDVTSISTQSPSPTQTGWVYDPNTGTYKKV